MNQESEKRNQIAERIMTDSIYKRSNPDFPIWVPVFLLSVVGLILSGVSPAWAKSKKRGPVPVGVAQAFISTSSSKIELPGTILPWAETKLAAEVEGRVTQMMFQEGQYVKKGKALVKLRTRPLLLQKELAVAEKNRVEAMLVELRTGTRKEIIEAAQFAVEQAEAKVRLTDNEFKRIKKLYKDGVLSLDEYDRADADADGARAELDEKQAVLKEFVAGPRIEKIQQEEANLQAAVARIKIIEDDIKRATLYAPFSGYIIRKETEVGQWLEKGDPAVFMIAHNPLKVEIHVPQFQFNAILKGTPARIILESYQSTSVDTTFKGSVIEKIRSGDPVSRTFPIRIKIDKPDSSLAAGMLVRVEILPKKKSVKKLFVPKDAVVRTPRDTSVWVVREEKDKTFKARKIKVKTGKFENSLIAISFDKGEIQPGDWVVVQGNERLKPNSQVKIINRLN